MKNFGKTKISSLKQISGFTLIELLIVIAVLGVLAAVVLVAINPAEQVARGRDAGRHSSVAQLAHAMTAYFTAQGLSIYPATSATWQDGLVSSKEITNTITTPATTTLCGTSGTNRENNICYSQTTPSGGVLGGGFVVWTLMESLQQSVRANGGASACTSTFFAAIYDSTQGKEGAACLTTAGAVPNAVPIPLY